MIVSGTHSIKSLVDNMRISKSTLCSRAGVSYRALARMMRGDTVIKSTANKILFVLSQEYNETLTLDNVTGINTR